MRIPQVLGTGATFSAVPTSAVATEDDVSLMAKILAISLMGAGIVAAGLVVHRTRHARMPANLALVAPSKASASIALELPSGAARAVSASADPVPPRVVAPVHSTPPPPIADGRLAWELKALERARQALAMHKPGEALRLLDRYRAQFAGGVLGSEETVLRVQALLATGDREGAQALADTYSVSHPDSVYARRLKEFVGARNASSP
jgi:hypothetical protein